MATKTALKNVYGIAGEESLLVREALTKLKEEAGVNEEDAFDLTELDGEYTTAAAVFNAASTAPFLADRRTVILHRADRLHKDEAEKLAEYIPSLPESGLLIAIFESGDEKKPRAAEKILSPVIKKRGHLENFSKLKDGVPGELRKRAESMGSKLSIDAAGTLAEMTSNSLTLGVAELEKCILYSGKKVEKPDVLKVVAPSPEWNVFHLLDAVCESRLGAALVLLKRLLAETPKVEEAAMRGLFPQLHRQLRLLWQAKVCALEKARPETADDLLPKLHNLATAHSFVRGKSIKMAAKLSLDQISEMMRCVVDADMRLKGQLAGAFPSETVERMLAEMCQIAARRN